MMLRRRSASERSVAPMVVARALLAVVRRPDLWTTTMNQARVTARPGWWRHWPPWPMPSGRYLAFRMETAYGSGRPIAMSPGDVVGHLEWCRDQRKLSR